MKVGGSEISEELMVSSLKKVKSAEALWCQVVAVSKEGLWVDIGDKAEGFIPVQEMKSCLSNPPQIGENILAYVIEPPAPGSQATLSIDKARPFLAWYELKRYQENGESLEATVVGFNKGGLLVRYREIRGFVPLSQLENRNSQLKDLIGKTIKLKVLEADQKQGRLILSQKAVIEEEKKEQLSRLNKGEIYQGRVTGVHDFGAFVDIGGIEGLVPASELSWTPTPPQEVVQVGQEIKVMVLKANAENKKLVLSFKRTNPHPWELVAQKYQVGDEVQGTVVKLLPFGAIVRLDGTIDALAHISELSSQRINHPKEVLKTGQELTFKVINIDRERRRLSLSLKQVQGR